MFTLVLTLGQAIFCIGGFYKSLGIMIAGRVVFGYITILSLTMI